MNKLLMSKSTIVIILVGLLNMTASAAPLASSKRNIYIAGLVVASQTLRPIESVNIYSSKGTLLGATDKNGYFKVMIVYPSKGEIKFKMKVAKQGYEAFTQKEHWGDLSGDTKSIMYFGLTESKSKISSFSKLDNSSNIDLSYPTVLSNFDKVRRQKEFDAKLLAAKAGNEHVLITVDGKFYITNSTGWIQLKSDQDTIVLNNKRVLVASALNAVVERKDVKWMTPLEGKSEKFGIYTTHGSPRNKLK